MRGNRPFSRGAVSTLEDIDSDEDLERFVRTQRGFSRMKPQLDPDHRRQSERRRRRPQDDGYGELDFS